jgi:hypothetical protein
MTFDEWLDYGIRHDYCSEQFCETHESGPITETELEYGIEDLCQHMVRLGSPKDWDEEIPDWMKND